MATSSGKAVLTETFSSCFNCDTAYSLYCDAWRRSKRRQTWPGIRKTDRKTNRQTRI